MVVLKTKEKPQKNKKKSKKNKENKKNQFFFGKTNNNEDDSVDSMDDDMHISSDQRGSFKKALELTQVDDEECDACTI